MATGEENVFEGMWKQMKGQVREWWGKLTDDDVEKIGGRKDRLLGALQERYGWTRQRAEDEINLRMRDAHHAEHHKDDLLPHD